MTVFLRTFERVFTLQLGIALAVFGVVTGLLAVAVMLNRARRRRTLPYARSSFPALEYGYVVFLGGAAAFLAWLSLSANDSLSSASQPAGASAVGERSAPVVRVAVTAYQWCWRFDYQQAPVSVTASCADRDHDPVLVVPTGQPVRLSLTSRDVVHSMWIPAMGVKKDAMPDHVNNLTVSFERPGTWLGRCSEFCGSYHTTMDFYVRAVPPEQYRQWLAHGGASM